MKNYCPRCGTEFRNNDKFCSQCGHQNPDFDASVVSEVPVEKIVSESTPEALKNVSPKRGNLNNKSPEETQVHTALICGIIALVFCVTFNMMGLILSIVGLINAIKAKKELPARKSAIIVNTIALAVSGIVLICGISLFTLFFHDLSKIDLSTSQPKNEIPIAGRFNCQSGSNTYDTGKYNMVLYLDNYNRFTIGTYGSLENNKATGTYTYKYLNKTDPSGKYKYYEVNLKGDEGSFIYNGEIQDDIYTTNFEFAITEKDNKKEALIFFTSSSGMNYCFEE